MLDRSAQGIKVEKPTTPCPGCRIGLFVSLTIGKGEMIGYYYGFMVYASLIMDRHKTEAYQESMMQVTADTFWK